MKELYWLSVLGNFSIAATTLTVLLGCLTVIFYFSYIFDKADKDYEKMKCSRKYLLCSVIGFVITATISILTPTNKDLLLIYGLGGTIDYIKSNDTAKQIPDRCIDALDKFVSEYLEEETK